MKEGYYLMNDKKSTYTSFLYAHPSFLEGIARIVDVGNVLQEYNMSSGDADKKAIRADWRAVENDMCKIIKDYCVSEVLQDEDK